MAEISYVNTVNVNIGATPQGMTDFVIANIGLFTNDVAGFADEYRVYVTPETVKDDFGSESVTYKMANAIFAQTPNLRSGNGALIIAPYVATNATASTLTTVDVSGNIENLQNVTDGGLNINGQKVLGLNFTGIKTLEDVAEVIKAKSPDVEIDVVDNTLVFTNKQVGSKATISITSVTSLEGTDITGASYLNITAGSIEAGTDAEDTEKLSDAVTRVASKIFFGGVLDTVVRENASIEANAKAIEALSKKIYVEVTASIPNAVTLGETVKTGGYKKTRILGYGYGTQEDAKCMAGAYLSKALSTNYTGSNTCITMNLKELNTIMPDKSCSDNTFNQAITNGFDVYGSTSGLGCVYSTKSTGGYMDDQTGIIAFTGDIEVACFNVLKQTNTKVPQTEQGMANIKNACINVCEKYVNNGYIGTGLRWNSSEKFGDPEDFDRNIEENGYYVYSLPVALQSQTEREARKAPLVQIAVKSAGAIHIINVNGTVEA